MLESGPSGVEPCALGKNSSLMQPMIDRGKPMGVLSDPGEWASRWMFLGVVVSGFRS